MRMQPESASRAITDYFNSPTWNAPQETDVLATVMSELMREGQPVSSKELLIRLINKLEQEGDQQQLENYRRLLTQLMENSLL
ncbi:biofilm development regulator YmgB/AriR family protein [Candidatus Pantoea multigeneris]|uniref:Biofilm development protein YmgB/AriR n=1 Tax=Candidatus Pantoea multigeneris TaxID=2608357 RepID=A0ABX0RDL2_9GAMM|nr:biofilm development regulator YmgB/AriR family protein [Pantoea multigeneris]NIF23451.1 hypothetical protein [Pantoea multigeneris]